MQANSRQISSNQPHLHPKLASVVMRHLGTTDLTPVAPYSQNSFQKILHSLSNTPRPLVFDSFCGTGHSTALLSQRHPDHLVVGIDKSKQRLRRHPETTTDNYLLLQANCEDIWKLAASHQLHCDYHYVLYPNPWPKAKHLQRRIHGHPAFPLLLQLGGRLELRSNWQTYAEEFGTALHLAGQYSGIARVKAQPPLTLFEQKYRQSGHALWSCVSQLSP